MFKAETLEAPFRALLITVLQQVAEMHGELMEFNEMLHRQLNAKDAVLKQLRQELVTLRGPVRDMFLHLCCNVM